jgi:hypothetical protein
LDQVVGGKTECSGQHPDKSPSKGNLTFCEGEYQDTQELDGNGNPPQRTQLLLVNASREERSD